jgi:capsular polysaccharide biosynthesis protein
MNSNSASQLIANAQPNAVPASRPKFPLVILFFPWILVVVSTILVTEILPESFSSTTRIKIEHDHSDIPGMAESGAMGGYDPYFIQTEFELIQSELILGKVIDNLDLNKEWGKKYANGERLKTSETLLLLKSRMDLRPIRNTSLIAITVFSEKADEAARIANAIADAYREGRLEERASKMSASVRVLEQGYEDNNAKIRNIRAEIAELSHQQSPQNTNTLDQARRSLDDLERFGQALFMKLATEKMDLNLPATSMVQIVDKAVPGVRPVRPNKPLNIFIGIVVGGIGGLFLATLVYVLQRLAFRREAGIPRTQFPPRFRAIVHVLIALVIGVIVGYHCANPQEWSTLIVVPLSLLIGGIASAYIELANSHPAPPFAAAPGQTKPNDATM